MLKLIILILIIAMIVSLAFSGVFLIKDAGKGNRTKKMLGIRVTIAALLLLTIGYGISTGELRIKPTTEALTQEPSASKEPLANKEPSANQELSANKEPSAGKEPSANKEPSAE